MDLLKEMNSKPPVSNSGSNDINAEIKAISLSRALKIKGLSDIHIIFDMPDILDTSNFSKNGGGWIRAGGVLIPVGIFQDDITPSMYDQIFTFLISRGIGVERGEFSLSIPGGPRLRVAVRSSMSKKTMEIFIRIIPSAIPSVVDRLTDVLDPIISPTSGIFLVSGVAGSGKSTILASLASHYLRFEGVHIVTIEDPVEYILPSSKYGYPSQRDVGSDVDSFAEGLKLSLREDPDVILVGEIRDDETARVALTAAETGHMVLSTLHASNCFGAIDRYLALLGGAEYDAMRFAHAYIGGVHIDCNVDVNGNSGAGLTRTYEFFWNNDASRTHIRERKTHQLGQSRSLPVVKTLKDII